MSTELRQLYQAAIIEHGKRPRNFRRLNGHAKTAEGSNPLCGDTVTVYVDLTGGVLRDVAFQGSGCALSTASASLMTEALKGKSLPEALQLCEVFHGLVTAGPQASDVSQLGTLAAFGGVRAFPSRRKCALLAWQTLQAALKGD